jgi:hypothetical protein
MPKVRRIALKNLPATLPTLPTITLWLFNDRLGLSPVGWGVFWTLIVLWWALSVVAILTSEPVDVLK